VEHIGAFAKYKTNKVKHIYTKIAISFSNTEKATEYFEIYHKEWL